MVLKMAKFLQSELNKTIRTLYESLLWKAFLYPTEIKEYSQCNSMMTVYNKIKSPIIESFLTGKKDAKDCYAMRQVHIKSILVINPDYDELICDNHNSGPHSHSTRFLSSVMDFLPP